MQELDEPDMQIETKVGIQQIVAILSVLFSIAAAYFTLKSDVKSLDERISRNEKVTESIQVNQNATNEALHDIKRDTAVMRYQLEKQATEGKK